MKRKLFASLNARKAASALAIAVTLAAVGLAGCSSTVGEGGAGASLSNAAEAGTVTALVESVDGDELTVMLLDEEASVAMQEQAAEFAATPDGNLGDPATMAGEEDFAAASNEGSATQDETGDAQDVDAQDSAADAQDAAGADEQDATAGEAPEASGGADAAGEPPAMPEGETSDGTAADSSAEPPAKPEGEAPDGAGEPPAMPDGEAPDNMGEPPAKPEGEASDGSAEPPAMPNGEAPDGAGESPAASAGDTDSEAAPQAGQETPSGTEATLTVSDESIIVSASDGEEAEGSLADIQAGSLLTLTVEEDGTTVSKIEVGDTLQAGTADAGASAPGGQGGPGNGEAPGGQGGPGGGSSEPNSGTGATTFAEDATEADGSYDSSASDESAVMVDGGATVALSNATVTKTGDSSSSEDSDFYGLNAGVLALDGANLALDGGTVTTDAKGANGVFAYGEGTQVSVSDLQISTSQGNSGGIEVAGGASLSATNLTVDTQGQSSAAIRSDRGGGTETVTGGSYTTHGTSSPAIYCTADVTVSDATLEAENSEGIVIEGFNSVTLENDDVTGNVNGNATRTGVVPNVMIYQSMSGDAEQGTGTFTMKGGSFTAANGTLFYVTNTSAVVSLEGVDLDIADDLLIVAGNDGQWGNEGANGGTVDFTATDQVLSGNITVDDLSSAALELAGSTSYEGAINASGQAGTVGVDLAEGATWTLTADSYVSSLTGDTSGIDLAGHTLYVNGEAWNA